MILYSSPMSHPHGHVMLLRSIGRTGQTWPAYWSGPRPGPPRGHFVWSSTVTLGKHLGGFHPGNKTQVMDFWPETNGFDMFWYVLTKKSGENHHFKQEKWEEGWSPSRKNGEISQHKDINFMRIEMIHPLNTRWIPAWGRVPLLEERIGWFLHVLICSLIFENSGIGYPSDPIWQLPLRDGTCHGMAALQRLPKFKCDQRLWVAQMATDTQ